MLIKLKVLYLKIFKFEFWDYRFFYALLGPIFVYLAVKYRNFRFHKQVNTFLPNGGFFYENKELMLAKIPAKYLPQAVLWPKSEPLPVFVFDFPVVAKTLDGQRGNGVFITKNITELENIRTSRPVDLLLQEFVSSPIELAIFYSRLPNESKGIVSSVTEKELLKVKGNGQNSIWELLMQHPRGFMLKDILKKNVKIDWASVPLVGEDVLIEPIGNHCRGTIFKENHLLDRTKAALVCDEILKDFEGFYYGRFDMKIETYEKFYNHEGIRILELNGVNADVAHIFEPNYSFWSTIKAIYWHWNRMAAIAKINGNINLSI